jgi:hypothetical protein
MRCCAARVAHRRGAAGDQRRAAEYGAHLPLADLGSTPSLASLKAYARAADALGYAFLCVNDYLLFHRPWLDGPTALAAVIDLCRHRDYAEAAGFRLPEASRREASDGVGPVVVSA